MLVESIENRKHVMERNPNFRKTDFIPALGRPGDKRKVLKDCGKPLPFIDRIEITAERKKRDAASRRVLQGY